MSNVWQYYSIVCVCVCVWLYLLTHCVANINVIEVKHFLLSKHSISNDILLCVCVSNVCVCVCV